MSDVIDMKKVKWELRKRKAQEVVCKAYNNTVKFVNDNKEFLVVAVPSASMAVKKMVTAASSAREDKDRKVRFYDHKLGCYWYAKRPLKPKELLNVQNRLKQGESYGDILASMKLLK